MRNVLAVLFGVVLSVTSANLVFAQTAQPQTTNLQQQDSDDDTPEVTARVARISLLNGTAKVRRAGGDWEAAVQNLPLVEGDEIATDPSTRLEIQIARDQFVRLDQDSNLKITTLADDGVALSLSMGSMSLTLTSFDKSRFFEIDAPKTTIAAQSTGVYRIDAGKEGDQTIRVAVTGDGEARIYSDTAGFTLKNDRSTQIFIDGPTAGEWNSADALTQADDLDNWSRQRDDQVRRMIDAAYYGKYYDDEMFGAEDLNGHGRWVKMDDYGYVWRPDASAIAAYANWSPYRYGHWSWMQPFGWIWVNDEPWGWATYHYGRWFWADGYWNWSPYGYFKPHRSWWQPALVAITVIDLDICWYPLNYRQRHCDFDRDLHGRWNGHGWDHDPHHGGTGPREMPGGKPIKGTGKIPPPSGVPGSAVVAIGRDQFGRGANWIRTADPNLARTALERPVDDTQPIQLPNGADRGMRRTGLTVPPPRDTERLFGRVGAAKRQGDKPLDPVLKGQRFSGVRERKNDDGDPAGTGSRQTGIRRTPPAVEPPVTVVTPPKKDPPAAEVKGQRTRITPRETPPSGTDTIKREPPKAEPPGREPPRSDPPKQDPPKREPPRSDPPKAEKPAPKPEPKTEKAPPKTESKPDTIRGLKKDGN